MKPQDDRYIKAFLPQHEPSESVWEKIEGKLAADELRNDENDSDTLRNKLPVYSPSETTWDEIEHQLNATELRSRLPEYIPNDSTWSGLDKNIGRSKNLTKRRYTVLKWAAVLIIVLGAGQILKNVLNEEPKLEYRVEYEAISVPTESNAAQNSPGAEGIEGDELIEQLCRYSQATCDTPEFKELESELEQLETARAEIKAQLNPYADNAKLERMLVHIELEHSKIVNEMTQKLL